MRPSLDTLASTGRLPLLPTPAAADGSGGPGTAAGRGGLNLRTVVGQVNWREFSAAIALWERILGRPAPYPTEPAPRGGRRLSPWFSEWVMGLPAGHVCDVAGLSRNDKLRIIGNGVVSQQCTAAVLDAVAAIT